MKVVETSIKEPEWSGEYKCGAPECGAQLKVDLSDMTIKRKGWLERFGATTYDRFEVTFICPECGKTNKIYKAWRKMGYPTLYWAWHNRQGEGVEG
jgi:predicted RNA-binding Zn-ribbon protein involved in translation (DUF1610 family)